MSAAVMSSELVPSVSIANLVNQRQAVLERLEKAAEILREAAEIATEANIGMPRVTVATSLSRGSVYERSIASARLRSTSRSGATIDQEEADRVECSKIFRVGVDASAWQYLMHESGLRTLMDATARQKWDKSIMEGDVPELNEPNIRATFRMLHDSRAEMFERGVIAVFKNLAWCYKTNLPQKFGKRIVQRWLRNSVSSCSRYGSPGTSLGMASHQTCEKLDDLIRVFYVLDGKPEPDHRNGWYSKLCSSDKTTDPPAEDDYLSVKSFRNGNGHITFKRPDLVEKMNLILAKHYPGALPAPK